MQYIIFGSGNVCEFPYIKCLPLRDGEHYDAKECFDFVFSNDFCPALREVFQCVTLPGATCPVCKQVFQYQLSPDSRVLEIDHEYACGWFYQRLAVRAHEQLLAFSESRQTR